MLRPCELYSFNCHQRYTMTRNNKSHGIDFDYDYKHPSLVIK